MMAAMHRWTPSLALVIALLILLAPPARAAGPETDAMAARVAACTLCHGREGRATSAGYFPRIAGKPAGYLYQQLLAFRDGRRQNAAMAYLLAPLSDDYLREIAAHFAALDLPYPPPQAAAAPPAVLARGATLVREGDAARGLPACTACHGAAMTGLQPSMPGLLGLPRDYLIGQLGAWREGLRHAREPDCMAEVARRLAPEDVTAVTLWLSSQPPPPGPAPAALAGRLPMDCGSVRP
jgi:cytochrome c553